MSDEGMDRRRFLKAVAATAVAATATGAGAALLKDAGEAPAGPTLTTAPSAPVSTVIDNRVEVDTMRVRLLNAESENVRLRAELDAARRRLDALETTSGNHSATMETLRRELDESTQQVGLLSGLVALYDQLDQIDLGDMLSSGLDSLDELVDGLADDFPSVSDGLALGQAALDELEEEIPALEAAQLWLSAQFGRLGHFYDLSLNRLRESVDNVGDFLQMLGSWFADLLRWIPFGRGENAARVVESLTELLDETTYTIQHAESNGTRTLTKWMGREPESGEVMLKEKVIRPLREQALTPAGALLERTSEVETTYRQQLSDPARARLAEREALRLLIATYREENQLQA